MPSFIWEEGRCDFAHGGQSPHQEDGARARGQLGEVGAEARVGEKQRDKEITHDFELLDK